MNLDADTISIGGDVVGRDKIVTHIENIYARALSATEEAEQTRAFEIQYLAQGLGHLARRLQAIAGDTGKAATGGPYKGLLEYRLSDAEIFFGRDRAIHELLACLGRGRLSVLHSESGAGKTSLLQAGISPRLIADGHLPVYFRPYDAEPVYVIKRAFLSDPGLTPTLTTAPLRDFLRQVCGILDPKTTLFIFLDQFEEFFTLLNEPARAEFVRELTECIDDESLSVRWMLALRTEFFGSLASFRPRIRNPFENDFRLNRLTRNEAARVVVAPAARRGITFEDGLVDALLDDLGGTEIAPPQMQLVCAALFDELEEGEKAITRALYERRGSAAGILRGYLEQVLSRDLEPQARATARRLLESLISSEQQRIIRPYAELVAEMSVRGVTPETLDVILNQLVDSRLLSVREVETEPAYELAHDYLLSEIRLDPEVQARKAAQELLEQEARAYRRYKTLLSEERFKVIEPYREHLRFTPEAERLFNESRNAIRQARAARERRRNAFFVGAIVVALLMTLLAAFGLNSSAEAQKQAAAAQAEARRAAVAERLARVRELVARGQALHEEQPLLGLRLALEGWTLALADDANIRASIERTIRELTQTGRLLKLGGDVRQMYSSPDGSLLILARVLESDELRHTVDGSVIDSLGIGRFGVSAVYFNPNPRSPIFVVVKPDPTVEAIQVFDELRNTVDGSVVEALTGSVEAAHFSPSATAATFVLDYSGTSGEVRSAVDGSLVTALAGSVVSVTFSLDADAATFVVDYANQPGELRRSADGKVIAELVDEIDAVRFSPDPNASYIFVRYDETSSEVRRGTDGSLVARLAGNVDTVRFSPDPDATFFVVDYAHGPGALWSVADGSVIEPLPDEVVRSVFGRTQDARYFVLYYRQTPGELRRTADGSLVRKLDGVVAFADRSSDPAGAYFIVRYTSPDVRDEVRRVLDSSTVKLFEEKVGEIDFSPDATRMVVDYSEDYALDELRSIADESIREGLNGEIVNARFSPDAVYVVLDYDGQLGEIRRMTDGAVVVGLTGEVDKIAFSPDGAYFLVDYVNGLSELWNMAETPHRLLDLGLGRAEYALDLNSQRIVIRYSDSRTYLIDLRWLNAMGSDPEALSVEDLVRLACEGLMESGLFKEDELKPYLEDQPPQACR